MLILSIAIIGRNMHGVTMATAARISRKLGLERGTRSSAERQDRVTSRCVAQLAAPTSSPSQNLAKVKIWNNINVKTGASHTNYSLKVFLV